MPAELEKPSLGLWLGLSVWLLSLTGCYLGFGTTPLPSSEEDQAGQSS